MTVWIVEGHVHYEGDYFLGVFSSKELADEYLNTNRRKFVYDDYSVFPAKVDEPS